MCSSGMCDFTILLQVLKVVLVILFFFNYYTVIDV